MGTVPVLISYLVNEGKYRICPLGLPFMVDREKFEELFGSKMHGVRELTIPAYRQLADLADVPRWRAMACGRQTRSRH